jgi:hypothetical protein
MMCASPHPRPPALVANADYLTVYLTLIPSRTLVQAVIFETLEDLTRCLEAVLADGNAVVVRIKNRYARDYDSDESAGYRCPRCRCS